MPLYIGDYLRDTMGLSAQEHGAYLLLLMRCWIDRRLAGDSAELLATARLESQEVLEKILNRYFYRNGEGWRHKRVDREVAKREHLADIGRKGGQARSKRKTAAVRQNAQRGGRPKNQSENLTETKAPHSHSHSHSHPQTQPDKNSAQGAAVPATRPLYHLFEQAFVGKNEGFDYKREGRAIKALEEKALSKPEPEAFAKMLLVVFWPLTHGEDKWWRQQPFLPSVLASGGIYPRVLKAAENMKADQLSAEQERIIAEVFA